MTRLCPLFSGSTGNSYYIGSAENGILIDVGRSAKQTVNALAENGLSKYQIKVYSSAGTIEALEEKNLINEKVDISPVDFEGREVCGMNVKPFHISHDCREGFGYVVESSDGRRTGFATDTGYLPDDIRHSLKGCDTVVLESNHDVGMLNCGVYPYVLKKRILSDKGHLSNETAADAAAELVRNGTTRLILAHLSRENNMPELAYQSSLCVLKQNGMKENIDFLLSVAPVENKSGAIIY